MSLRKPLVLVEGLTKVLPVGDVVSDVVPLPNYYREVTYSGDFVSAITLYKSPVFIAANRVARSSFSYTSDFLSTETIEYFEEDGTTVAASYVWTHNYSGDNLSSSTLAVV